MIRDGRGPRTAWLLLWPLLQKLVAQKIMDRLGGQVRCAISGGAALPPAISKVFIGLGLNLLQGYGLTEFSPVASVNLAGENDPASVGPPLEGVQVRIGEDDELLLKGVGVMQGYWNNHSATREAIDADGWLHTGDKAKIVGRHVHIIGRIKGEVNYGLGRKVSDPRLAMKFWGESGSSSYPWKSLDTWFITENKRWGKFDLGLDTKGLVEKTNRSDLWIAAAKALGLSGTPTGDSRGVETFFDGKRFDPADPNAYLKSLAISRAQV